MTQPTVSKHWSDRVTPSGANDQACCSVLRGL